LRKISFRLGVEKGPISLTEEELKHITKLRKRPDLLERFAPQSCRLGQCLPPPPPRNKFRCVSPVLKVHLRCCTENISYYSMNIPPRSLVCGTGLMQTGSPQRVFSPMAFPLVLLWIFLMTLLPGYAVEIRWIGGNEGVFGMGANWEPAQVPAHNDRVVFAHDGECRVAFTDDSQVQAIQHLGMETGAEPPVLLLDLAGRKFEVSERITLRSTELTGERSLVVQGGHFVSSGCTVGGSTSEGRGRGPSSLRLTGGVRAEIPSIGVGNERGYPGVLTVDEGSMVEAESLATATHHEGAQAQIFITGPESTIRLTGRGGNTVLSLGMKGRATAEVTDGGRMEGYIINLGRDRDSSGRQKDPSFTGEGILTVSGSGSIVRASQFYSAGGKANDLLEPLADGSAEVKILNGGRLEAGTLHVFPSSVWEIRNGTVEIGQQHHFAGATQPSPTVFEPGSRLQIELPATPGAAPVQVADLHIAGAFFEPNLPEGFRAAVGARFPVIQYYGELAGEFSNLPQGASLDIGGYQFTIDYAHDGNREISLLVARVP